MNIMTMENNVFDDEGVELCKPIEPKQWIELIGHNIAKEIIDKLAEHLEILGLAHTGSGNYPNGSRWHGFKVDKR